jgi:hypothetical protein
MPQVTEIAPDIYRICVRYPEINLQFCHFLINDEEPLLFHTGLRRMFSEVREGVAKIIDPSRLRWISWSHFESDECGSLNDWLAIAPHAQPACNMVGALVSVNDFCGREARVLSPQDTLAIGKHRLRYYPTPHLPHGWDAGVLFDETESTLLCSDLFTHNGEVEPLTPSASWIEPATRCPSSKRVLSPAMFPGLRTVLESWKGLHRSIRKLSLSCTVPASMEIARRLSASSA